MDNLHQHYMKRCLELALLGQGNTHPNPMVGCVVLDKSGRLVGEGFHARYGGPHAEVVALDHAGDKAHGGSLYVNLEPCCHVGKTPPCVQKVLEAGIQTVYCGMTDPNPKVDGKGIETLCNNGLTVYSGILEEACRKLNEAFVYRVQTGRPFMVLKHAMTLDGRIATRNGQSRWITGPMTRRWVHQLRSQCDAVLTTAQTVMQDNSRLTVRDAPLLGKPPVRIVLDRRGCLDPGGYQVFQSDPQGGAVWWVVQRGVLHRPQVQQAQAMGVEVLEAPAGGQGFLLDEVVALLGERRLTQVLVEAGGKLAGALLEQRLIQKAWLLYGDQVLRDPFSVPGFQGKPVFHLDEASRFKLETAVKLDNNLVVEAYLQN